MKKIFLSTWMFVLAIFFMLSQDNMLLFGAEEMMDKPVMMKEKMETEDTMKKEGEMMK